MPRSLLPADELQRPAPLRQPDLERDYLGTCQKLEQLLERKKRSDEGTSDIPGLHRELSLVGSRIQREPSERSNEEDYLAVLHRLKEALRRKIEAAELKGEFQKLHMELLGFGHKLGFDRVKAPPAAPSFESDVLNELNLDEVERQIAGLQGQIRALHDHR